MFAEEMASGGGFMVYFSEMKGGLPDKRDEKERYHSGGGENE